MMQTSVPQSLFFAHGPSIMHTSQSPVDPSLPPYRTRLALDRPISHRFSKDLEELQWDALKGVEFDEDESMYRVDEEDEGMDEDEADDAGSSRHDNGHHHRSSTPSDRPRSAQNQSGNLSFALSERADIILANAKKKLSLLSNNLQGARHSLHSPSPTPSQMRSSWSMASLRSTAPTSPFEDDDDERPRSSSRNGFVPRRQTQPSPFLLNTGISRVPGNTSPTSPRSGPVRGSKSMELIGDNARGNRVTLSPSFRQPSLGALVESDGSGAGGNDKPVRGNTSNTVPHKTTSMKDLKSQASDLKERLALMQKQSREDILRRQSLRAANTYNKGAQANGVSSSVLDTAGGPSPMFPPALESGSTYLNYQAPAQTTQNGARVEWHEVLDKNKVSQNLAPSAADQASEGNATVLHESMLTDEDSTVVHHNIYDMHEKGGIETAPRVPPATTESDIHNVVESRHEDRADAFDYEHFILHSGLGSVVGSEDASSRSSTSLPKATLDYSAMNGTSMLISKIAPSLPPIPGLSPFSQSPVTHSPSRSTDSLISHSARSNATARGRWSDIWPVPRGSVNDTPSMVHDFMPEEHKAMLRAVNFAPSARPVSSIFESFMTPADTLAARDHELILSLAESLRECCAKLERAENDGVERRVFRARLESARRALRGK